MKPFFRTISYAACVILLIGCDKFSRKSDSTADPIFAVIHAQIKALNKRDVEGVMALMHPEAPDRAASRNTLTQIAATAELLYTIQDMTLESAGETEARVRFTEVIQKISGPEFRNHRVFGVHTLRKYHGAWKIYSTQQDKVEFLDQQAP